MLLCPTLCSQKYRGFQVFNRAHQPHVYEEPQRSSYLVVRRSPSLPVYQQTFVPPRSCPNRPHVPHLYFGLFSLQRFLTIVYDLVAHAVCARRWLCAQPRHLYSPFHRSKPSGSTHINISVHLPPGFAAPDPVRCLDLMESSRILRELLAHNVSGPILGTNHSSMQDPRLFVPQRTFTSRPPTTSYLPILS